MSDEDPYESHPWTLRKTLKRSCVNLWGAYSPILGRYSEALVTAFFGVAFFVYPITLAFRYQDLLRQESIDSAIMFGVLMGIYGVSVTLLTAAAVMAISQAIGRRFIFN